MTYLFFDLFGFGATMDDVKQISLAEFSRHFLRPPNDESKRLSESKTLGDSKKPGEPSGRGPLEQSAENSFAVQVVLGMSKTSREVSQTIDDEKVERLARPL